MGLLQELTEAKAEIDDLRRQLKTANLESDRLGKLANKSRQAAEALSKVIREHLHKRRCHDCGNIAWHKTDTIPHVLCRKCGSQDTRKARKQGKQGRKLEE